MKKLISILIIGLLATMFVSCSKHSCVGIWEGRGQGTQYAQLVVKKDGTFDLRIFPEKPDNYIALYIGEETNYSGKWESKSDGEVILTSEYKTETSSDSSTDSAESTTVFYFRKDGALCEGSPSYESSDFDLIKQEQD